MAAAAKKGKTVRAQRIVVGWREWAAFPDLGVEKINAKIDTGAKSSAVHAFRVREIGIDGEAHAEFFLHPLQGRKKPEIACCEPIVDRRVIRSSNGQEEERLVIRTRLAMGERIWKIDLTLADRDAMGFRLLIGRDALGRKYLVNPAASYALGR